MERGEFKRVGEGEKGPENRRRGIKEERRKEETTNLLLCESFACGTNLFRKNDSCTKKY